MPHGGSPWINSPNGQHRCSKLKSERKVTRRQGCPVSLQSTEPAVLGCVYRDLPTSKRGSILVLRRDHLIVISLWAGVECSWTGHRHEETSLSLHPFIEGGHLTLSRHDQRAHPSFLPFQPWGQAHRLQPHPYDRLMPVISALVTYSLFSSLYIKSRRILRHLHIWKVLESCKLKKRSPFSPFYFIQSLI